MLQISKNVFQGYREVILTRKTVKFILRSNLTKSLASWSQDISFAEEIFFATLARIDTKKFQSQGIVQQNLDKKSIGYNLCPRRTLWNYATKNCFGQSKRWMCNLSLRDLVEAQENSCLFMNKFDLKVDSRPVNCLRETFTKS